MYGLFSGPISMLIMECLARMFGMELVKDTVGFCLLAHALGAAIGAPVGGWIYDISNNFNIVFAFSAVIYLIAALCGWVTLYLNRKYDQIKAQYIPL